jgi:hypothetical protein
MSTFELEYYFVTFPKTGETVFEAVHCEDANFWNYCDAYGITPVPQVHFDTLYFEYEMLQQSMNYPADIIDAHYGPKDHLWAPKGDVLYPPESDEWLFNEGVHAGPKYEFSKDLDDEMPF